MARVRVHASAAERQRAYRQRRNAELEGLRLRTTRRPRHEHDVYDTPPEFVAAGLQHVTIEPATMLDIGAGSGVWGEAARARWPGVHLVGVELRDLPKPAAYDEWLVGDFRQLAPSLGRFGLILGNPPYREVEAILRQALPMLAPKGELLFLLRLAFREGQRRARGLFSEYPLAEIAVCDRRPRFYGHQGGMTAFAYFRWRQGFRGETLLTTAHIPEPARSPSDALP